MTNLLAQARREDVTDYYSEPDDSVLGQCLDCTNLQHPLSKHELCATCEAAAHADELKFRWLTNPTNTSALVEAEIELRVWQAHEKEMSHV